MYQSYTCLLMELLRCLMPFGGDIFLRMDTPPSSKNQTPSKKKRSEMIDHLALVPGLDFLTQVPYTSNVW